MARDRIKPCVDVGGKVRLVARIRGFRDQELALSDGVSVINVRCSGDGSGTDDKVAVSFDGPTSSRKNEYMVDCCYGQSEDNGVIFSKEVKPHISRVFDGESFTFIAFGARGSGKTYTIQDTGPQAIRPPFTLPSSPHMRRLLFSYFVRPNKYY
nr:kinesin-like protein KIN-10C [Tanacetum cinerariifolium]